MGEGCSVAFLLSLSRNPRGEAPKASGKRKFARSRSTKADVARKAPSFHLDSGDALLRNKVGLRRETAFLNGPTTTIRQVALAAVNSPLSSLLSPLPRAAESDTGEPRVPIEPPLTLWPFQLSVSHAQPYTSQTKWSSFCRP